MRRYLKPLVAAGCLMAALFLTVTHGGSNGGIALDTQRPLRAAPQRIAAVYDLSALDIFTKVLGRVKESYVEPQRIRPKQMLIAAMNAVEQNVAEVLAQETEDGKSLRVRVQDAEKTFRLDDVTSLWALSSRIKELFVFMQSNLQNTDDIQAVEYAATNGMLSVLDPHSLLLVPDVYREMKLSTRGQFGGLGIVISMIQGTLTVVNPMKGTPAEEAGLKPCDQILRIGDESTVNMTLTQAVSRLRGAPGSTIEIMIQREGWKVPRRRVLTRAVIKVDSVTSRMLAQRIGYIRLASFQGNSTEDVENQLARLLQKRMRGLILDLRGNPGGLLDQAIKLADMFIESGTLVTTVTDAGKSREEKRATVRGTEGQFPMVVLVDNASASASEIVAGALKELDRAVVMGRSTFGKGSVQVLYDHDDGSALKLTVAQYLTPGDLSIQSTGIVPDIVSIPMVARPDFVRLKQDADGLREKDLTKHLTHTNVRAITPLRTVRYLITADEYDKMEEEDGEDEDGDASRNVCLFPERKCRPQRDDQFTEDFQIRLARDLLTQASGWRRSQILAAAEALFKAVDAEQDELVVKELSRLEVDWRSSGQRAAEGATAPPLQVTLTTVPPGNAFQACQETKFRVTVTHTGTDPVTQLHGVTEASNRAFSSHELLLGRLLPGEARSWDVPIRLGDVPTRVDRVTVKLTDAEGHSYPPHHFKLKSEGIARPTFSYSYQLVDDIGGNLDGRVQRGEQLRLFVRVRNTGRGTAFSTVTHLNNLSGPGIFMRKGRFVLGELQPGESKTASFTFDVKRHYEEKEIKLELSVYDSGLREGLSDKLAFPVVAPGPSPEPVEGIVTLTQRAPLTAWAADNAAVVGHADAGAVFPLLGKKAGWYRILAEDDRPAFVRHDQTQLGGVVGEGTFEALWQVTPPTIALSLPGAATAAEMVTVKGLVTDETQVLDVFIFVRNREAGIRGRKVFYQSNRHAKDPTTMRFEAEVPLWPGANYVTVYARENNDVRAREEVVIFRKNDA